MKEKILNHLKTELDPLEEMQKVSSFVDLALIETLKKEKLDQLPFLFKQLLILKEYLSTEINHSKTQLENTKFILKLESEKPLEDIKKKESELEEEQLSQESLSEIDQLTSLSEEEN